MRKFFILLVSSVLMFSMTSCKTSDSSTKSSSETETSSQTENSGTDAETENTSDSKSAGRISIEYNGNTIIFELNNSQAAQDLYDQLPLSVESEDYSDNEKIFYPSEDLNVSDAPEAEGGAGVLAYYEPWGDVVMFYDDFDSSSSLYELGRVVSGSEWIEDMSGTIEISQMQTES
ncbi:cyclophilin-like fold protein [Anaerostipes butyraticus]|uniref:cyclophilin-like fold protein n=1 Tax=Anaerostipes butyraticus TaxID=645466 RepID=UPI0023A8B876|nr:cyclophilin-like fold protein [Anaerostipes butyraticus]